MVDGGRGLNCILELEREKMGILIWMAWMRKWFCCLPCSCEGEN